MDENMEKKIKDSVEKIEVPKSLTPESMEQKFEQWDDEKYENPRNKEIRSKKRIKKFPIRRFAAAAAAVAVVIAFGVGYRFTGLQLENQSNEELDAGVSASADETSYSLPGVMHTAKSYEEVTDMVKKAQKNRERTSWVTNKTTELWGTEDMAVTESEDSADVDSTGSYSKTNVRTEGVDEGDIVKTDGTYLYQYISSGEIRIVKTMDGKMKEVSIIDLNEIGDSYLDEFILDGNRLYVIAEVYDDVDLNTLDDSSEEIYSLSYDTNTNVYVLTYDLTDKTNPKLSGKVKLQGGYDTLRYKDGYLYVMTRYDNYRWYNLVLTSTLNEDSVIPRINDEKISADSILLPEEESDEPFYMACAIDVENPNEVSDVKAVMGYVDDVYVSKDNIYLYNRDYEANGNRTVIAKFSYENGTITPKAAGAVKGDIDDSFSIDEDNDGNLRIMTTLWTDNGGLESSLYILNKDMKRIGALLNIAGNEGVKSCRFMGDYAYVVTFRNTDPLFTIDVSNPKSPEILSELKLPGFSEYLHIWNSEYLLGIGFDADEESGSVGKVKLSMFQISDPSNVSEITTKILEADGSTITDGDYKSILIDPEENLFGFYMWDYGDDSNNWTNHSYYKLFRFTGEEFEEVASIDCGDFYNGGSVRGVYIGDYFYLVLDSEITSYDRTNGYSKIETLN
ncbi:MAG: beta-propeller domain-containing protein [Lachnospiraceae bacterium]|nr:beta-propeller domain-containing protein [Lachnospiraceae bacterium]